MFKKREKGFTLIELMVVIAIIAILATVVLVALQSARDAAQDSNRKSAIAQIRSLAEVQYAIDPDSGYTGLGVDDEIEDELIPVYGDAGDGNLTVHGGVEGYCAYVKLITDSPGAHFCVSSDNRPDVFQNFDPNSCLSDTFGCADTTP